MLALGGDAVPVAIRVNYDAPNECPNAAAFYDAVSARTDHVRPAVGEEPRLDVTVRVTRDARGFAGEVREVVNGKESAVRSMDGQTCKEVVEALSLTVALSIDPNAHAPAPKPPSTPAPSPVTSRGTSSQTQNSSEKCREPPVENPPEVASEGLTERPSAALPVGGAATPLHLEIGLGVLGTLVDTAGFSLGGGLFASVLRESSASTSSSFQVALAFASTGFPNSPSDHRARFGALSLDACPWRRRFSDVELAPCALASLGVLEVTGRGVSDAKTVDRAWFSAGLDGQLSWLLGHGWAFEGALGGTVPLVRRRYFTSDAEHVVAQTPVVSPLVRLGLGFRF